MGKGSSFMPTLWPVYLEVAAITLMWSHAPVTIKYCLRSVTPWELVILRHVPAAIAFSAYWAFSGGWHRMRRMVREDGVRFVLLGLFGVTGYHFALNSGMRHVSAGAASLIIGMSPIFTFFVAAILLGERPTWVKAGGIALAFAGLYICVRYGSGRQIEIAYLFGALITLLAPLFGSLYTTLNLPMARKYGALDATALMIFFGTLPLLFTVRPSLLTKLPALPASFWAADLFLGLGCTSLAFVIWARALRKLEATKVAVFIYVIPPLGVLWGRVYLGEVITGWLMLGAAMIIAGIIVTNRAVTRAPKVSAEVA